MISEIIRIIIFEERKYKIDAVERKEEELKCWGNSASVCPLLRAYLSSNSQKFCVWNRIRKIQSYVLKLKEREKEDFEGISWTTRKTKKNDGGEINFILCFWFSHHQAW